MSDSCPGEWAEGRTPQLAGEEGGDLAWGGRVWVGELGDGRWPEARPLCHMRAANVEQGTIATTGRHVWDFPL